MFQISSLSNCQRFLGDSAEARLINPFLNVLHMFTSENFDNIYNASNM